MHTLLLYLFAITLVPYFADRLFCSSMAALAAAAAMLSYLAAPFLLEVDRLRPLLLALGGLAAFLALPRFPCAVPRTR